MHHHMEEELDIPPRRYALCPSISGDTNLPETTFVRCHRCEGYVMRCCHHPNRQGRLCHHSTLVFVDGACLDNARASQGLSAAGIGIDLGPERISLPIHDDFDQEKGRPRTNQRAELLAAIHGLDALVDFGERYGTHRKTLPNQRFKAENIVATDSNYVVQGICDYVPGWKRNNWKRKGGKPVKNLDLFKRLDARIEELFQQDFHVQFYWIDRQYNEVADRLAADGANKAKSMLGDVVVTTGLAIAQIVRV